MSRRATVPTLLLLVATLAQACQPLPHPFADNRPPAHSPVLSPRDSAGIFVEPVTGVPQPLATDLAEAMAAALRDREIPASTQGRNRGSFTLIATLRDQPGGAIDWTLQGPDGRNIGHVASPTDQQGATWRNGGAAAAKAIAGAAAPSLARLIQDEPPVMAVGVDPVVAVFPVTGAPGDGARSLTRAMGEALRRANVALAETPADHETFVLAGTVLVSQTASGKQRVKVSWALLRPDGSQIGEVSQENSVPAGSLDGAWGDVAYAVASAAVPGISALIERAQEAAATRGS